jgi:hypothetical protein
VGILSLKQNDGGVKLTGHPHLVPLLKMLGAIFHFPLCFYGVVLN